MKELRDTDYAREIATANIGEVRIERLFVKEEQQEEIRLSWWPKGQMAIRPLDVPEALFIELLAEGIRSGVLSPQFLPLLIVTTASQKARA